MFPSCVDHWSRFPLPCRECEHNSMLHFAVRGGVTPGDTAPHGCPSRCMTPRRGASSPKFTSSKNCANLKSLGVGVARYLQGRGLWLEWHREGAWVDATQTPSQTSRHVHGGVIDVVVATQLNIFFIFDMKKLVVFYQCATIPKNSKERQKTDQEMGRRPERVVK